MNPQDARAPLGGAHGGSGDSPGPPGGWGTALPPGVAASATPGPQLHTGDGGLATGALVCGIASIPMGVCCSVLGIPLGLTGVVLGLVALQRLPPGAPGRGQAIGGIATGLVGVVGYALLMIATLSMSFLPSLLGP